MTSHETYIERCFELARRAGKEVKSNPRVGCVIVYKNKIIGEGYHKSFGMQHAEIEALNNISDDNKKLLSQSRMYVSLEPCCIYGKTPPCSAAILKAGIKNLYVSCEDPNPEMRGKSLKQLKDKGVHVVSGLLKERGKELISPFMANLEGRPHIVIKFAQTSDNYVGKKDKRVLISNPITNRKVHNWRSDSDGILVGYNTALLDNPSLTTRLVPGSNPLRIVIDRHLSLPTSHHLWNDEFRTLFISEKSKLPENPAKRVYQMTFGGDWLNRLCKVLYTSEGICRLIVEGGPKTIEGFIDSGLWDEIRQIKTQNQLKSGVKAPFINNNYSYLERFLDDEVYYYFNNGL